MSLCRLALQQHAAAGKLMWHISSSLEIVMEVAQDGGAAPLQMGGVVREHAAKDHRSLAASSCCTATCCLVSPDILVVIPNTVAGAPQAALQSGPQHAALLAAAGQWAASADAAADLGSAGARLNPRCVTVKLRSTSPSSRMGAMCHQYDWKRACSSTHQLLSCQTALVNYAMCNLLSAELLVCHVQPAFGRAACLPWDRRKEISSAWPSASLPLIASEVEQDSLARLGQSRQGRMVFLFRLHAYCCSMVACAWPACRVTLKAAVFLPAHPACDLVADCSTHRTQHGSVVL